jgi:hypothetical protein
MEPFSQGGPARSDDIADALSVLRDVTEWSLLPDEWAEVDRALSALSAALTAGDVGMLRYEVIALELLGPARSHQVLAGQAGLPVPASDEVRDRLRAVIALIEQSAALVPVTIYLSDADGHERVQSAVESLIAAAGLVIVSRDDSVEGSWFRRMWASEAAVTALNAAESRLIQEQDAKLTAVYLQNLPALITALQPTKDAVVRAGAFLVVKVDWVVAVHQLTPRQQLALNHSPQLAAAPQEILRALGLAGAESGQALSSDDHRAT